MDQLSILKDSLFHLIPHYQGYNFLVILTTYNNINKFYLVLKKDLKMNNNEKNNNVNIFEVKSNNLLNNNLFNFSILEAKLNYKKEEWYLLTYDAYYISGKNLLSEKVINKEPIINNLIETLKNNIYNINLKSSKMYKLDDIHDLVYNKIKNNDFKINGLIFWPVITGKYYIYINDNEFDKLKLINDKYNNPINNNIEIENQNKDDTQKLIIQKTSQIDVYDVFSLDKIYRYGIACIIDMKTSHTLRQLFIKEDQIQFNCYFNKKFNKWCIILN